MTLTMLCNCQYADFEVGDFLNLRCRNYDKCIPGTSQKAKCRGEATCEIVSHSSETGSLRLHNVTVTTAHDVGICADLSDSDIINERAQQQVKDLISKYFYFTTFRHVH